MEIAPQVVMTKTYVPRIACRARPQPAMLLAPIPQSSPALLEMDAALLGAIALMTMIVLPSAKIISSRREKPATAIAKQVAMTAIRVPRTLPTGAPPLVIFNVLTMPYYSVGTMTPAAQ